MSRIFTLEYEHTWPCWPADLILAPGVPREIWGDAAGNISKGFRAKRRLS